MRKFLFVLFLLLIVFFAAPQKADACNNFFPGNATVGFSPGFYGAPAFVPTNGFYGVGFNPFFAHGNRGFAPFHRPAFFFANNRRAVFFFR